MIYSAGELADTAGLHVATVHRLARDGYLRPSSARKQRNRRYQEQELWIAGLIAFLRRKDKDCPGLSMQRIKANLPEYRKALRFFEKEGSLRTITFGIARRTGRLVWAGHICVMDPGFEDRYFMYRVPEPPL